MRSCNIDSPAHPDYTFPTKMITSDFHWCNFVAFTVLQFGYSVFWSASTDIVSDIDKSHVVKKAT